MDTKSNAWGFGFFVVFNNFMFLRRENASLSEKYIYRMYGWFLRLVGGMDGFIKRPAAAFWPEALVISGWWSTTDDHCLHGCRISDQWDDVWDDTVRALAEWFANRRAALHWWDWLHLAAQHIESASFCCRKVAFTYVSKQTDIDGLMREGQTFQVSADDCSRYRRMVNSTPFRLFL